MALKKAGNFAGTIAGFGATDSIDLLRTVATAASVNGHDQLVIVKGAATVATLQLTGNYSGDTFSVASDGQGGSNVTVSTPMQRQHLFASACAGLGVKAAEPLDALVTKATANPSVRLLAPALSVF